MRQYDRRGNCRVSSVKGEAKLQAQREWPRTRARRQLGDLLILRQFRHEEWRYVTIVNRINICCMTVTNRSNEYFVCGAGPKA